MISPPTTTCVEGLGHPEGPYVLDDGRVIYANTYASEIGVYDPATGESGTFVHVGGGPNACVLGTDGLVYSTQTPTVGAWVAPEHRPPSIQRSSEDGDVEVLVTAADGVTARAPNDLAFGPDGRLYYTDSGDWDPENKPHDGLIVVVDTDGRGHILENTGPTYPNGIVVEPDGSLVWVESYPRTVVRRTTDGAVDVIHELPEGHIPDGLKIDVDGNLWITTVTSGGLDVLHPDGRHKEFVKVGDVILNCIFAPGGALYCCDMGVHDTSGASFGGSLIRADVGVEGMAPFRGAIA